jgi:hypothetical protein
MTYMPPRRPTHVYIIHATEDRALALFLKKRIAARSSHRVFVASEPGDIPIGEQWLPALDREIGEAKAFLILLTPRSITKSWVWFEAGAAWHTKKDLFPVVAGGLSKNEPSPLSGVQALALDDERRRGTSVRATHRPTSQERAEILCPRKGPGSGPGCSVGAGGRSSFSSRARWSVPLKVGVDLFLSVG